jgi:hypothetical protein
MFLLFFLPEEPLQIQPHAEAVYEFSISNCHWANFRVADLYGFGFSHRAIENFPAAFSFSFTVK